MPKVNLLLVDDRPDGLITLEAVLSRPDYNLVLANSGRQALSELLDKDFAAIILDVQMPEMDGFETASLIKEREKSRDIPIIFVTAISKDSAFVFKGYESGAVDYIFKPFDPYILRSKVAVFVELYRKNVQIQQQAELLRQSEEKLRNVIESARDIIVTVSETGNIVSLNGAFEAQTGFKIEDWLGKPIASLFPLCPPSFEENRLIERKMITSSGAYISAELSVRPLLANGKAAGRLSIIRDISERKQMEDERRRRKELESKNRELEQFAYVCSHDLQEPLRIISTYSEMLKRKYDRKIDGDADQIIGYLTGASQRMSLLIRDLLEYSKAASSEISIQEVQSSALIEEAMSNLKVMIGETHATIRFDELPSVYGNSAQLVRLFQNLISNAIKFRADRAPLITVSAERRAGSWIFSVQDNGIGFDPEYSERIFEIFERLEAEDRYPGTGMGLAICKKIVERHSGKIWAISSPQQGATFYFSLPENNEERLENSAAILIENGHDNHQEAR